MWVDFFWKKYRKKNLRLKKSVLFFLNAHRQFTISAILADVAHNTKMKNYLFFIQFIAGLLGSIIFGFVGLILGSFIGCNFDFPAFGGNVDYEAGGAFFAIVGISIGCLLGIMTANKVFKEKQKYTIISIAAIITAFIGLILFDYNMPPLTGLTIFLFPSAVLAIVANWQKFIKKV